MYIGTYVTFDTDICMRRVVHGKDHISDTAVVIPPRMCDMIIRNSKQVTSNSF